MTEYRYALTRKWSAGMFDAAYPNGQLCWIMLNPSTADDLTDDQTIRRCTRFSKRDGYSEMVVVNLFAARATHPTELLHVDDPIGPHNDTFLTGAISSATAVVFGWGATIPKALGVNQQFRAHVHSLRTGHRPLCLGLTADGHPRHPSRVRCDQPLVEYTP